jgi:hypothetical protein
MEMVNPRVTVSTGEMVSTQETVNARLVKKAGRGAGG